MRTVVVVGNPRSGSRTRLAAELLVERLMGSGPHAVVEVADLGTGLLGTGDPTVAQAKAAVRSADLLVVASPTYKATYTGLLKVFLDQFGAGELGGVPTVPVMLGASAAHALAAELTLKPVLVEIGCSCPTPALYLLESTFSDRSDIDAWVRRAAPMLPSAPGGLTPP